MEKKKKLVRTCSNSKKKNIKEYSSNLQDLLEEKMFMTPQRLYSTNPQSLKKNKAGSTEPTLLYCKIS